MAISSVWKEEHFPIELHNRSIYEFIKVYLPDQSRQRLLFPPEFSKHLKWNIPTKIILQDLNGKQWHMNVEQTENGVWFGHGWDKFVTDCHLQPGNFLVFQYDGISLFHVKIYRNDFCLEIECPNQETLAVAQVKIKKEETICPEPIAQLQWKVIDPPLRAVKVEGISKTVKQGKSKGGVILSPTSLYFTCVPRPLACVAWLPTRVVREIGTKFRPYMLFRDQVGEISRVNVIGRFKGRLGFGKGWKEFCERHPLEINEEYMLQFSLCNKGELRKVVDVRVQGIGS
ncbi:B3 domain-containing protein REM22-like [Impatiens glandulifera]|uniref:B3 domain-containing protein REM22-like n=1 Tax=Impatiens glandulifera TaxID=253017 RepID=UPI001FB1004C|nr:B3 domain-containing protein REM22-like [Impatiens glandulifera]